MKGLLAIIIALAVNAQRVEMKKNPILFGSDQKKPDASAQVEVFSSAKGFLPPRMTTAQRDLIATPAAGLEIYNSDSNTPEFFNGVSWVKSGGTGTSFQYTATAHGRAIGCPLSPVYFDGSDWVDARADATATLATHVITKVVDVDTIEISQSGRFSCNGHGLTAAQHYYTGVSGGLANLPAPVFNNPVVFIENTNTVHVMPYRASSTASTTVGQVDTVFGRAGNVVATIGDYLANLITNTPAGTVSSTNVQDAINELDADIQAIDVSTFVANTRVVEGGEGINGGSDLSTDTTLNLDVPSLTDGTPVNTDVLLYHDGTNHRKATLSNLFTSYVGTLADLSDVDLTGQSSGQVLTYNGVNYSFTNKTINTDNQTASLVPFTPFSFYSGANLQAIIPEIEMSLRADISNKANSNVNIIAGTGLSGGGDLTSSKTLSVNPSAIDITTLQNFNANSFVDMSTVSIDVTDVNDGLQAVSPTLDSDVTLRVDIPSLDRESPAKVSTDLMAFSTSTNKLVKVGVQDVADAAALAVGFPVDEVNGQTGIVLLDTDDVPETTNRVYVSPAQRTAIGTNTSNITTNTNDITQNTSDIASNLSTIGNNTTAIALNQGNITSNDGDITTINNTLGTLGSVAFSDDYNDLINLPTLGTAAATAATDYATAAQGALADSAIQAGANVSIFANDANYITAAAIPVDSVNGATGAVVLDADDIEDATTDHKFVTAAQRTAIGTNTADIATNASNIATNVTNISSNDTDIATNASNIATNVTNIGTNDTDIATNATNIATNVTNISSNDTDIATNVTNIATNTTDIANLATVASTGDYGDLLNRPTLGTAAATDATDYATAAQGLLANSALQIGDPISDLVNDSNFITAAGAPVQSVNGASGTVVLDADDIDDATTTNKFATAGQLSQIATNTTDIGNNSTAIGNNATAIGNNATNISTNATNIGTNDTDIATNVTNISTNTTDIATLNTDKADKSTLLTAGNGLIGGGDLSANRAFSVATKNSVEIDADAVQLVGDQATVPDRKYYGTNAVGVKGFHDIPQIQKSFLSFSGRVYLNTDNRWVSMNDDIYGVNYFQMNESGGVGANPIYEWEHMGMPVPTGIRLSQIIMYGRVNSAEVTDLEIVVVVKTPNAGAESTGFDADAEVSIVEVFRTASIKTSTDAAYAGNFNDFHKYVLPLGDFVMPNNGQVLIYLKPVGTLTAQRYFYQTFTLEMY